MFIDLNLNDTFYHQVNTKKKKKKKKKKKENIFYEIFKIFLNQLYIFF